VLDELRESLERIDQDYIVSAWCAAFRIMRLHPASEKQFALSAAELLAQLSAPSGTYPEHDKQAVIISARSSLAVAKIEEHWGDPPPVTELHVVAVHRLEEVIELLYTHAGKMTYGDVASAAPHVVTGARHTPGLSAPVISDEAVKALRLSDGETSPVLLIEASLWLLADWDGMVRRVPASLSTRRRTLWSRDWRGCSPARAEPHDEHCGTMRRSGASHRPLRTRGSAL
jgi:hypothetical protein